MTVTLVGVEIDEVVPPDAGQRPRSKSVDPSLTTRTSYVYSVTCSWTASRASPSVRDPLNVPISTVNVGIPGAVAVIGRVQRGVLAEEFGFVGAVSTKVSTMN